MVGSGGLVLGVARGVPPAHDTGGVEMGAQNVLDNLRLTRVGCGKMPRRNVWQRYRYCRHALAPWSVSPSTGGMWGVPPGNANPVWSWTWARGTGRPMGG